MSVIELILKGKDQASDVINNVGGSLSGLGSVAAGVATGGLALAAAAIVAVGLAGVTAGAKLVEFTMDAAAVSGTEQTFKNLTEGIGGVDNAITLLQESTRNMVTESDLQAAANKFLTMGITETAEETANMAEMATQLGLAMNVGPTKAMEDFALMMANQSIPRLDTFGISSGAVKARIIELQASTEGLSREQAFNIAVMEEGTKAMARVGEQGESAAATTAKWETAIGDLTMGIGGAFVPALEAIRKPALAIVQQYGPKIVEVAKIVGEWLGEKIPIAVEWLSTVWERVFPKIRNTTMGFWRAIKPAIEWIQTAFRSFITTILPHLEAAWDTLSAGWEDIVDLYNRELKPALDELWEALGIGAISAEGVGESFGGFGGLLTRLMTAGTIEAVKNMIEGLAAATRAAATVIGVIKRGFDSFRRALDSVRHALSTVVDWINRTKNSLGGLKLPSWLRPGSPTPLETGLLGIGKAFAALPSMDWMAGGVDITSGSAGRTVVVHNHFGAESVRSDRDIRRIQELQERSLRLHGVGAVA